ncbi:MAG: hypothetical protein AB7K71_30700 [Polyangiaceae bacterium]
MAGVALQRAAHSRSEWFAYVLSGLPGIGLVLLYLGGWISEPLALGLFALSFVGLNMMHMAATWSRVYLDGTAWRRSVLERVWIPALLVVVSLVGEAVGFAAVLLSAQYFLSLHHATMENYGIARFGERKAGRTTPVLHTHLLKFACALLPLGALVWRVNQAGDFHGIGIFAPPLWLGFALMAGGGISLLIVALLELREGFRGRGINWLGLSVVFITNLSWTWLLLGVSHPLLPLYALASGHYVQHLYFVGRFEGCREAWSSVPARIREWVQPGVGFRYYFALFTLGGVVVTAATATAYGARWLAGAAGVAPQSYVLPPWTAAMIGINLSHYWLDHRIWRLSKREVAAPLGLAGAR